MPYQPPRERSTRRARVSERIGFLFAAVLVALAAYFGYVGYEGSRQLTDAPSPSSDCRTPAAFGWEYEAVNYDVAGDAGLANDPGTTSCEQEGAPAGSEVVGPGGVRLAGWYVPAGNGAPPSAPTVVLVHGWGSNKSNMLERAALLHEAYNLLFVDLRNHGQSGDAQTTQGVREADDVRAMLDWLERTNAPGRIVLLGVSMGGATVLAAARNDERVDAVIVESTHATMLSAAQARLDGAGYPLSVPGSWAILLGALLRTGEDVSSADAVHTVEDLDGRPLLLIYGGSDTTFGKADGDDVRRAADRAGSDVELVLCPPAGHAASYEACPEQYREAVLGFLDRVAGAAG